MLARFVYERIAITSFVGGGGGSSHNLDKKGGVRGQMWYSVKASRSRHNLSIETDTLSRTHDERITKNFYAGLAFQIWGKR